MEGSAVCVASRERLKGVDIRSTLGSKDGRHRISVDSERFQLLRATRKASKLE